MEQLINFIIRPPRAEYDPKTDLLDQEFMLKGKWFQRKDVEVKNSRGLVLQCSHYVPIVTPEEKPLPCVIYCHGNSGCRADASEAAIILLPSNITVFTLDFSGSGLSEGDHVTLGWNEKDDLRAAVDYLRSDGNVSLIGLWGRSMGAVTSLFYGAEDPSIAGMVLDSSFSDLVELMLELVDTYKIRLPKFTIKFAIQYMRRAILKKAKFDITELNTIKVAKSCFVPVLIGHAIDDDFIRPHHSDRIFDAYVGDKNIIKFEGDHNSPRPQFYFDSINIFFHNVLQPPEDEVVGTFFDDYFGKGRLGSMHDLGLEDHDFELAPFKEPGANSTEEAIGQVRKKRPMSRTDVPSDIPSQDKHSEAEREGSGDNSLASSSSRMISFELSNGHPYGPHVPTTVHDDEYIEYPLGSISGFPSNVEEEERMFMEAVLESLKDLEMRNPDAAHPSSGTSNQMRSSEKHHSETTSSNEQYGPSIVGPISTSGSNSHNLPSENPSPDVSESSREPTFGSASSLIGSSSRGDSARSDVSVTVHTNSDGDTAGGTKATLTVVKNPSGHIMDGLKRRWDLNFFRNSR